MRGQQQERIVVVDTETTGRGHVAYPPRADAVVQVGYAWRDDLGRVRTWHRTCNPGEEYLAGGRAGPALTVDEILAADRADAVASQFKSQLDAIESETGASLRFLSYNRAFDEPFLRLRPWLIGSDRWGRCIMKAAAQHLDGPNGRWPRLVDAVRRLSLTWPDGRAHSASVDANAALLDDEALGRAGRHEMPVQRMVHHGSK